MKTSSCYFELEIARAPIIIPKNDLERHTGPNLEHPAPSPECEQIQQNLNEGESYWIVYNEWMEDDGPRRCSGAPV
jgi:hypothetical protein